MTRRWWWLGGLLLLILVLGIWPLQGRVIITTGHEEWAWPRFLLSPPTPEPRHPLFVRVTDEHPWSYVLLTANGRPLSLQGQKKNPDHTWTWSWTVPPEAVRLPLELAFYRDCDTGCRERGRAVLGERPIPSPSRPEIPLTKLCLAFARPDREWYGRQGWVVDLTYARAAADPYWGIDALAWRVFQYRRHNLRVLVRLDFARGQSLPPAGDTVALSEYLDYARRLARDARLKGVYAYIIGSGFNAADANRLAPSSPVTPEWYARVLNGYGEPPEHTDNIIHLMRSEDPRVRVLVGPVRPWTWDQGGTRAWRTDVPWLNYMNTLVALVDEAARRGSQHGIPLAGPDGFALHVPGRPEAAIAAGYDPAQEPRLDLPNPNWNGAQQGFRLYREWLDIINSYPTTRGRPVYITSSNTYAPDLRVPPAQNYPPGWLTTAYEVIRKEPQIHSLCWFLDHIPGDRQWRWFDLTEHPGKLIYAAEEWDRLLHGGESP